MNECDWPLCRHPDCAKLDGCSAPKTPNMLRYVVENIVADAAAEGLVLTVEQVPLQPLAMGHYQTVVSVRRARGAA